MFSSCSDRSCKGSNTLAAFVAAVSLVVLYTSFDPAPAGEDIRNDEVSADVGANFVIVDQVATGTDVPIPPDSAVTPRSEEDLAKSAATGETATAPAATPVPSPVAGVLLDNNEGIRFSIFMLREGEKYLESIPTYSTIFSKQERINGDLSDNQIIEMKVQHQPNFSVYMKWKNSDAGRQLLFSEQYEDGQMVVKLGGLKGRLLPAIKLDPRGARAMGEARYPVTEAGLLGMLKQIIAYREEDLKRGHGVTCRRLPNQQFDDRNCMCFLYEYDSAEHSPVYRKSIILIDTRHGIPVMARSYTWARDAEELTAEELDQQTLIENYSFTSLNIGAPLITEDFSRNNPKYRM